jgi:hypothetical protein
MRASYNLSQLLELLEHLLEYLPSIHFKLSRTVDRKRAFFLKRLSSLTFRVSCLCKNDFFIHMFNKGACGATNEVRLTLTTFIAPKKHLNL